MDGINQNKNAKPIGDAASDLLDDGKRFANELYKDGVKKVGSAQKEALAYTDEVLEHVRTHPLEAVLIAGGIGFLLSALLRENNAYIR